MSSRPRGVLGWVIERRERRRGCFFCSRLGEEKKSLLRRRQLFASSRFGLGAWLPEHPRGGGERSALFLTVDRGSANLKGGYAKTIKNGMSVVLAAVRELEARVSDPTGSERMERLRQEIGVASNRIRRLEKKLAILKESKKRAQDWPKCDLWPQEWMELLRPGK